MLVVEVDIVNPETLERALYRAFEMMPIEAAVTAPDMRHNAAEGAAVGTGDLGGDDDRLPRLVGKPLAEDNLGRAIGLRPGRHRIHLGRIVKIHTAVISHIEQAHTFGFFDRTAEGHGAETNIRDEKATAAEAAKFHSRLISDFVEQGEREIVSMRSRSNFSG